MKSKISIAVSTALAAAALGAASSANAALVADAAHFFPTSGSTAMNNPINEYFLLRGGICEGSTTTSAIDVYTDGTFSTTAPGTFGGFHQMLFVCKSSANLGSSVHAGDTIAIAKEGDAALVRVPGNRLYH